MENLRVMGQPVARKDGADIVSGNVVYGVAVVLLGMLHGKVLRSPIPSGRVARLENLMAGFTYYKVEEVPC